ncbi:MAG: hypothetical protein MJA82_04125 [Clostridia bacterium]|nr:hypothetical protein [Clostridia bacterium]
MTTIIVDLDYDDNETKWGQARTHIYYFSGYIFPTIYPKILKIIGINSTNEIYKKSLLILNN